MSSSFPQYIPRVFPSFLSPCFDTSSLGSVYFLRWKRPFLGNTGTMWIKSLTSASPSQLTTRSSTYMLDSAILTVWLFSPRLSSA
ncbi:hypothetical protein T07_8240 [Trichinella nelsoni]|uniref:Uncharacterized protein n=1 Tax=Trichinella nelsoni TaxID=6336 RepID=A0A0V0RFL3_9BILA|nr:hypothetical protein T07_8240 [Trichinella nelsoni]